MERIFNTLTCLDLISEHQEGHCCERGGDVSCCRSGTGKVSVRVSDQICNNVVWQLLDFWYAGVDHVAFYDAWRAESGIAVFLLIYLGQVYLACPYYFITVKHARGIVKILYFGSIWRIYQTGFDIISVNSTVLKVCISVERCSSIPLALQSSKFCLGNSVSLHLPICVAFEAPRKCS